LTCCVCTLTMPLRAFAKVQRKFAERAVWRCCTMMTDGRDVVHV